MSNIPLWYLNLMKTNMKLPPHCMSLILIFVQGYTCTHVIAKFEHGPQLDGMTCSTTELVLTTADSEAGLVSCVAECVSMTPCMSVFYHSVTGQCNGCKGRYSGAAFGMLEDFKGTVYYEKQGCPTGGIEWRQSCYKTTEIYQTFQEGAAECVTYQGHAVYIDDAEEYDFLMVNFHDQALPFLYLGAYYNTTLSEWTNYGTKQIIAYNNWESNTNPGEYCAAFHQPLPVGWVDCDCDLNSPTLCEIDVL